MLEKLFDLISKVFTLTSRTDRNEKDIERLQSEIDRLTEIVNNQSIKIEVLARLFNEEREKTTVWVENQILKFERRLPSAKEVKNDDEK